MTDAERARLAELLRVERARRQLTAREVCRRTGVDIATLSLLERGKLGRPRIETLRALAPVLSIPLADIYTIMHWLPAGELPSLKPYMRAKYTELPEDALSEVAAFVAAIERRYGTGPVDGEDER